MVFTATSVKPFAIGVWRSDSSSVKIVRPGTLDEYARSFWLRESTKNADGARVWAEVLAGADPVDLMARPRAAGGHPYKLPSTENRMIRLVELDQIEEFESLLIHKGMSQDDWMRSRGLAPPTELRRLGDLARLFATSRYFHRTDADGTQVKCYRIWASRGNVNSVMNDSPPLIEHIGVAQTEIVDGWGRLLPFVVLVQEGFPFSPARAFYATSG